MRDSIKPDSPEYNRLIDRFIMIWKEFITYPKFDNGDNSETGIMTFLLQSSIQANSGKPTPEQLEAFGKRLKELLTTPNDRGFYKTHVSTDYGPDATLADAMEFASITSEAPWKTSTYINVNSNSLSIASGYGAESQHHYPLKNGKWLVTTLQGSDINLIFEYLDGSNPSFDVRD